MLKPVLLLLQLMVVNRVSGQTWIADLPASAAPLSAVFSSPAAATLNPAILALPRPTEVLLYTKRPYAIPGLQETRMMARLKSGTRSGIAAGVGRFWNPDYSSTDFLLAYGLLLKQNLGIGISTGLIHSRIKGFRGNLAILPGISIQWSPRHFTGGIFFRHTVSGVLPHDPDSWIIGVGIGKDLSDQVCLDAIVACLPGMTASIQVGLQYQVLNAWRLALRCQTAPFRYAVESGYQRNRFALRITADWHPQIGITPGVLLVYTIINP